MFQLMMPIPNHVVTKNLTGHRMYVDGPQISYPYNNSFQEIGTCYLQKLTVWPRKIVSSKKNTSKLPIFVCANLGYPTLEGSGCPWHQAKPTSVVPLKSYGYNGSNGLCNVEGWWHQNWAHTASILFSRPCIEICEKVLFLVKNFGVSTHGILMHSWFRKCIWLWWPSLDFEVIAARSEVIGQKYGVLQIKVTPPIFVREVSNFWSSGVSLKRSCKIQFRCVNLVSIRPPSQKLLPNFEICLF